MPQLTPSQLDGLTFSASDVLEGTAANSGSGTSSVFTPAVSGGQLGGGATFTFSNPDDTAGTVDVTVNGLTGASSAENGATVTATLVGNDANDFLVYASLPPSFSGYALFANLPFGANALTPGTAYTVQPLGPNNTYASGPPATVDACYAAGTRIATPSGEAAVEDLAAGDMVLTLSGAAVPVVWMGHRTVDCARHPKPGRVQPVRVQRDAFGPGLPSRDLRLSPDHSLYFEDDEGGALIPVHLLIDGKLVAQESVAAVTYYHVELAGHDVLLANGLPAESYLDTGNRRAFANGGGVVAVHPDFAAHVWEAASFAPLVVVGPVLEAARARLRARAAEVASGRIGTIAA